MAGTADAAARGCLGLPTAECLTVSGAAGPQRPDRRPHRPQRPALHGIERPARGPAHRRRAGGRRPGPRRHALRRLLPQAHRQGPARPRPRARRPARHRRLGRPSLPVAGAQDRHRRRQGRRRLRRGARRAPRVLPHRGHRRGSGARAARGGCEEASAVRVLLRDRGRAALRRDVPRAHGGDRPRRARGPAGRRFAAHRRIPRGRRHAPRPVPQALRRDHPQPRRRSVGGDRADEGRPARRAGRRQRRADPDRGLASRRAVRPHPGKRPDPAAAGGAPGCAARGGHGRPRAARAPGRRQRRAEDGPRGARDVEPGGLRRDGLQRVAASVRPLDGGYRRTHGPGGRGGELDAEVVVRAVRDRGHHLEPARAAVPRLARRRTTRHLRARPGERAGADPRRRGRPGDAARERQGDRAASPPTRRSSACPTGVTACSRCPPARAARS